jgi:hypothetical protein
MGWFGGIDLHSNNSAVVTGDEADRIVGSVANSGNSRGS